MVQANKDRGCIGEGNSSSSQAGFAWVQLRWGGISIWWEGVSEEVDKLLDWTRWGETSYDIWRFLFRFESPPHLKVVSECHDAIKIIEILGELN